MRQGIQSLTISRRLSCKQSKIWSLDSTSTQVQNWVPWPVCHHRRWPWQYRCLGPPTAIEQPHRLQYCHSTNNLRKSSGNFCVRSQSHLASGQSGATLTLTWMRPTIPMPNARIRWAHPPSAPLRVDVGRHADHRHARHRGSGGWDRDDVGYMWVCRWRVQRCKA